MEAKRMAKKDIISSLPSNVIEIILCRVPIRDAVRTSILSRTWRYNWATIPTLVFNVDDMFDKSNNKLLPEKPLNGKKQLTRECQIFYAIHQVLLLHESPILEFKLSMDADNTCVQIDQIILHLSRKNTIKKLALDFYWESSYKLPLSVLSFHQLTDLSLSWCEFDFSPTFSGFGSLRSLSLFHVYISRERLAHLISGCPLLECLSLEFWDPGDIDFTFDLDKLFKSLHVNVIQHLTLSSWTVECSATGELPTTIVSLKSLCMSEMHFSYEDRLLALFLVIKSSPNLEKIKLKQEILEWDEDPEINSFDDFSNIWLEHLNELEIEDFIASELEMEFVKLILAKSPVLKKVGIVLAERVSTDEEVKILRILLCFPRASPLAEIIVKRWC